MPDITLCEECFPGWADYEVHSVIPMTPCAACGRFDASEKQGIRCHLFPRDPRPPLKDQRSVAVEAPVGNKEKQE